jgi:hypothetical protein
MKAAVVSVFFVAMVAMPFCVQGASARAGYAVENGDVNGDFARDLCDAIGLLGHAIGHGAPPVPLATCAGRATRVQNGDIDGDGEINLADGVRFVMWLFARGRAPVAPCAPSVTARVVPIDAMPYGQAYGEWSGAWWRWAYSFPTGANPVEDLTGEFADLGQSGNVWLLAGTFGQVAERTVTVPAGKALFIPIANQMWVNIPELGDPDWSPEQEAFARTLCTNAIDGMADLACQVDGQEIRNIEDFRCNTPRGGEYYLTMPENNLVDAAVSPYGLELPAGTYGPSVDEGIYLMLAPLSVGRHSIHFTAAAADGSWGLEVTYDLTVAP